MRQTLFALTALLAVSLLRADNFFTWNAESLDDRRLTAQGDDGTVRYMAAFVIMGGRAEVTAYLKTHTFHYGNQLDGKSNWLGGLTPSAPGSKDRLIVLSKDTVNKPNHYRYGQLYEFYKGKGPLTSAGWKQYGDSPEMNQMRLHLENWKKYRAEYGGRACFVALDCRPSGETVSRSAYIRELNTDGWDKIADGATVTAEVGKIAFYAAPEFVLRLEKNDASGTAYVAYTGGEPALDPLYDRPLTLPAAYGGCPLTDIRTAAFAGCARVPSVTVPDSVTRIGASAFAHCGVLTSAVLPKTLKRIEPGTFLECASLTAAPIPEGTEEIGVSAFEGCTALTEVRVPASVTRIRTDAFAGCSALKRAVFCGRPETLTVESGAFPVGVTAVCAAGSEQAWQTALQGSGMTSEPAAGLCRVSVDVQGPGTVAGACLTETGTSVTLTAAPSPGAVFAGWVLPDGSVLTGTSVTVTAAGSSLCLRALFAGAADHAAMTAAVLDRRNDTAKAQAAERALREQPGVYADAAAVRNEAKGQPLVEVSPDGLVLTVKAESADVPGDWKALDLTEAETAVDSATGMIRITVKKPAGGAAFYRFFVPEEQ